MLTECDHVTLLTTPPVEVSKLARIPLGQPQLLPAQPGVYLAVDNGDRVWYAGIAQSLRDRISAHDRAEDFQAHGASTIAWQAETSEAGRRALEQSIIEYYHPPLNLQHNFNRLPEIDFGLSPDEEIERFFRLRAQLKIIELELERLKPNLVTRCEQKGGKIIHHLGSIACQSYKSWTYPEEIDVLATRLSRAKQTARESGAATIKAISTSPVCRLNADALSSQVALLLARIQDEEPATED